MIKWHDFEFDTVKEMIEFARSVGIAMPNSGLAVQEKKPIEFSTAPIVKIKAPSKIGRGGRYPRIWSEDEKICFKPPLCHEVNM